MAILIETKDNRRLIILDLVKRVRERFIINNDTLKAGEKSPFLTNRIHTLAKIIEDLKKPILVEEQYDFQKINDGYYRLKLATFFKEANNKQWDKELNTLDEREKNIIRLRYGLDDGVKRTLQEVGTIRGVSRERIRQLEAKALRKLRHPTRKLLLK